MRAWSCSSFQAEDRSLQIAAFVVPFLENDVIYTSWRASTANDPTSKSNKNAACYTVAPNSKPLDTFSTGYYYSSISPPALSRAAEQKKPKYSSSDSSIVSRVSAVSQRRSLIYLHRTSRAVPSPAFNLDSRRNEVQPLRNVPLPEMDDS